MTDLPVFLPLFCMFKQMSRLDNAAITIVPVIVDVLNIMEQILLECDSDTS